jgi:uncharacterized protein
MALDAFSVRAMAPVALVVAAAFTVESCLGFGATILTVALASSVLLVPIGELLPSFVPVNLAMSTYIAVRCLRDANLRLTFTRILPAMLLGLPVGMWAFSSLPELWLRRGLGVFLILLSAPLLFLPPSEQKPLKPASSLAFLGLAGILHGAFATGGPMVVYVLTRSGLGKAEFRATLAVLWAILAVILVGRWVFDGTLTSAGLVVSAEMIPPMLVGYALGNAIHGRVDEKRFRVSVNAMLLVFGLLLFVRR